MNEALTLYVSLTAIVISIASFVFTLYQYRKDQNNIQSSKASEVLRKGFSLRKASQILRDKISVTDDIDDCDALLDIIDYFTESTLPKILNKKNVSVQSIYKLQKELLALELEFDLLVKQINVVIDFNAELVAAGYEPLTSA